MYALVYDCTANYGTITAIGSATQIMDAYTSDTQRVISLDDDSVSVGDRIAIDWDACQIFNLDTDREIDRGTIAAAIDDAGLCCPEQVSDAVFAAANRGDDWRAVLADAIAADADSAKSLGIDE